MLTRVLRLSAAWLGVALAAQAGWETVQGIAHNRKIEVQTRDRKTTRATFVSATDSTLTARSKAGELSIARADIRRVKVRSPGRRIRNGIIGAAVGAGAGFALGVAICPYCQNEGAGWKYAGPLAGVGVGVGALAALPAAYHTIYKAK